MRVIQYFLVPIALTFMLDGAVLLGHARVCAHTPAVHIPWHQPDEQTVNPQKYTGSRGTRKRNGSVMIIIGGTWRRVALPRDTARDLVPVADQGRGRVILALVVGLFTGTAGHVVTAGLVRRHRVDCRRLAWASLQVVIKGCSLWERLWSCRA